MRALWVSRVVALLCLAAVDLVGAPSARAATETCESVVSLRLQKTTVATQSVSGEFAPAADVPRIPVTPFCRVRGVSQPVAGSRIGFELWLPKAGWNGKLKMLGNSGYSSALPYAEMAAHVKQGYAIVATDTGHSGDGPDFARDSRESIVDWGYRAVHTTAMNAKRVVNAFYGKNAQFTYFEGCSTGGHQAFTEAQRFPEDFDGIVAGAPGHNRTHLNAAFLWQFVQNQVRAGQPRQIVPARKLALLAKASFNACKSQNGALAGGLASDPFLNDPLSCTFDPSTLLCGAAESDECLTIEQIGALKRMYEGAQNPRTSQRIYFGWPAGSEASPDGRGGWNLYWADPQNPSMPARADFWRYWAFNDGNWNWQRFDFDADMKRADDALAGTINAMNANLERFRRRGGKLIHYHGMADPVVPYADSVVYQQRVVMEQLQSRGLAYVDDASRATSEFYRLFLAPGLGHCTGGPGAAPMDLQQAIENWVERGQAPSSLPATRSAGGVAGKGFTRPLCAYPQIARYNGNGAPPDEAASFSCATPANTAQVPRPASDYLR
jgi:feruloyl esterase